MKFCKDTRLVGVEHDLLWADLSDLQELMLGLFEDVKSANPVMETVTDLDPNGIQLSASGSTTV